MDPRDTAERIRRSPAFRNGRFHNRVPSRVMQPGEGGRTLARFLGPRVDRRPSEPLSAVPLDAAALASPHAAGARVTWLGHSTMYLELEGLRVLTDPVFSLRASPSQLVGPRRFQPAAAALEELPVPDVVVISHDHYDHLDRAAITALAQRGARFVAPLGVGALLVRWGLDPERVEELDWLEETTAGHLELVATPSRHFSGRGLADRNERLWASWVLRGRSYTVFFGGDGGLDEAAFIDIGERFGPFDLTLLEIGAFDPAWSDIHLGPENAVVAHRLLRGRVLLPIHWATFELGLHPWYAPAEQLLVAAPDDVQLALPQLGEVIELGGPLSREPWWRPFMREEARRTVKPGESALGG